jgi:hypothetical protein
MSHKAHGDSNKTYPIITLHHISLAEPYQSYTTNEQKKVTCRLCADPRNKNAPPPKRQIITKKQDCQTTNPAEELLEQDQQPAVSEMTETASQGFTSNK